MDTITIILLGIMFPLLGANLFMACIHLKKNEMYGGLFASAVSAFLIFSILVNLGVG